MSNDDTPMDGNRISGKQPKVLNAFMRWVGPIALAAAAWAHEKLSEHEVAITTNRADIANLKQQSDRVDLHFNRLDEKLDRILERLSK